MSQQAILENLAGAIIDGDQNAARGKVQKAIAEGLDPLVAVDQGLSKGMEVVGDRFENGDVFLPPVGHKHFVILYGDSRGSRETGKVTAFFPKRENEFPLEVVLADPTVAEVGHIKIPITVLCEVLRPQHFAGGRSFCAKGAQFLPAQIALRNLIPSIFCDKQPFPFDFEHVERPIVSLYAPVENICHDIVDVDDEDFVGSEGDNVIRAVACSANRSRPAHGVVGFGVGVDSRGEHVALFLSQLRVQSASERDEIDPAVQKLGPGIVFDDEPPLVKSLLFQTGLIKRFT